MHFVDILVRWWDVAASIGVLYRPDDDLAAGATNFGPVARVAGSEIRELQKSRLGENESP